MKDLVLQGFCDPHKSNKNYGSHKENYIRFVIECLIRKVEPNGKELHSLLEEQYKENDINQYPVIDDKTYWFIVEV